MNVLLVPIVKAVRSEVRRLEELRRHHKGNYGVSTHKRRKERRRREKAEVNFVIDWVDD